MPGVKGVISNIVSLQQVCGFARAEGLTALKAKAPVTELNIVERTSFSGTPLELVAYREHLQNCTYVFCPRGTENYSYRVYEALSFGRIPVLLDTDVVLPSGLDEQDIILRIPYSKVENCYDVIRRDFETRSSREFTERQQRA
jgi:hypothetical protein